MKRIEIALNVFELKEKTCAKLKIFNNNDNKSIDRNIGVNIFQT
jgi:hypothetical protein